MTSSGMEDAGGAQVLTGGCGSSKCNRRRREGELTSFFQAIQLAGRRPSAADCRGEGSENHKHHPAQSVLVISRPLASAAARSAARQRTSSSNVRKGFSLSPLLMLPCGRQPISSSVRGLIQCLGAGCATDDLLHRDLPQRRRVPARMPPAGLPRAAPDRGEAPRCGLAPRGGGRVLLPPPRDAGRGHPQGHRQRRPYPADRPHRRARRLRRRAGGDAARVYPRPGHGRDDRARVSRQAGDARPRPQRRHPLPGLRPWCSTTTTSASGRAASRRRG